VFFYDLAFAHVLFHGYACFYFLPLVPKPQENAKNALKLSDFASDLLRIIHTLGLLAERVLMADPVLLADLLHIQRSVTFVAIAGAIPVIGAALGAFPHTWSNYD
jgi:hypothetical protein